MTGCGLNNCTFYQDLCAVHLECAGQVANPAGSGKIVGDTLTFGTCTVKVDGKTMSANCGSCTFTATHR